MKAFDCQTYDSKEVLSKETFGWEDEALCFVEQFDSKIKVVLDVLELINFNLHHHIHSTLSFNRLEPSDSRKFFKSMV